MIRAAEYDFSTARKSEILLDASDEGEIRSLLLSEEKWYEHWYIGFELLYISSSQWEEFTWI